MNRIIVSTSNMPQFTATKYKLSDPELDRKITDKLNQDYWIENIIWNEDNMLIVYARLKPQIKDSDKEFDTINEIN